MDGIGPDPFEQSGEGQFPGLCILAGEIDEQDLRMVRQAFGNRNGFGGKPEEQIVLPVLGAMEKQIKLAQLPPGAKVDEQQTRRPGGAEKQGLQDGQIRGMSREFIRTRLGKEEIREPAGGRRHLEKEQIRRIEKGQDVFGQILLQTYFREDTPIECDGQSKHDQRRYPKLSGVPV